VFYEPDCSNLSKLSIGRSQGPLNHVLGTKLGFHNAFNVVVGCVSKQGILKLRYQILLESKTIEESGLPLPRRMANRQQVIPDFAFVYERVFDLGKAHNGLLVNVVMDGD